MKLSTMDRWLMVGLAGFSFALCTSRGVSLGADAKNPLDGLRAFRYLEQLCALGPRPSGSAAMQKQQELVRQHFEKLGGKVTMQQFRARDPLGGAAVPMATMIVEWHPERKERILLVAHYDTRPLP